MGVEPTSQPWEGRILPMKYTRRTYILYQSRNQKSRGLLKKYEVARILYVSRPHIRKIRQNKRAENKKTHYEASLNGFSFTKQRRRKSKGITENERPMIAENCPIESGTERNKAPPRYMIKIWITEMKLNIRIKGLFSKTP